MSRAPLDPRGAYALFRPVATRWSDNDVYGHVNNVVYYSWFDTAVNGWLIEAGALDIAAGAVIGLVVETGCRYARPLAFPQPVEAGCLQCGHEQLRGKQRAAVVMRFDEDRHVVSLRGLEQGAQFPAFDVARRAVAVTRREFLLPWIGRRLTGRSSGDHIAPRRPVLAPIAVTD